MIYAFGYLRVSGKSQVEGDGPERQRDAIMRFCRANQLTEPLFFFEKATSGTVEVMDRDEFVRMIEAVDKLRENVPGAEVCVIVERQDRLARTLVVQELLMAECANRNIKIFAADQPQMQDLADEDIDPTRKMFRQFLGIMAEWEKSVIVRKLRAARERKKRVTGRCEGRKPYGSTPEEARILRVLRTSVSHGDSFSEAAKRANGTGLRKRNGKPWTSGAVYQVVGPREKPPEASQD
jgi:DNA invertase Pin-like site-specific DNA recombinase